MQQQNVTQAELARRSGLNEMQVSRMVNGLVNPSAIALHAVAEALNTSISKLMG